MYTLSSLSSIEFIVFLTNFRQYFLKLMTSNIKIAENKQSSLLNKKKVLPEQIAY